MRTHLIDEFAASFARLLDSYLVRSVLKKINVPVFPSQDLKKTKFLYE
jgi:hypothetical protein